MATKHDSNPRPEVTLEGLTRRPPPAGLNREDLRAAAYGRLSQVEPDGTEDKTRQQLADANFYCEQRGWEVVGSYVDSDYSGYDPKLRRPDFEQLLADVEQGILDVIVVWKFDRLTRQPKQIERVIEFIEAGKLMLHSLTEPLPFGTENVMAVWALRQLISFANMESAVKSERQKRANKTRAERGLPGTTGGYRPFGFEDDFVTHRPDEAAEIRLAVDRIIDEGWPLRSICRDWAERGVTTSTRERKTALAVERPPKGRPADQPGEWTPTALRNMLRSPRIAGLRGHRYDKTTGYYDNLVKAVWDPIISVERWTELQTTLKRNKGYGRPKQVRSYLLGGFGKCGRCGNMPLIARPNYRRDKSLRRRYGCPQISNGGCGLARDAEKVEEEVVARLLAYTASEQFRSVMASAEESDDREEILAELEEITTQLKGVEVARHEEPARLKNGKLNPAHMPQQDYVAIKERLLARREELADRQARRRRTPLMEQLLEDPEAAWGRWTFDEKRAALADLLIEFRVFPVPGRGARRHFDPDLVECDWVG